MGLAEPKVRVIFSEDPQNKRWSEDTNKFGYQMLQKMGWKPGKGLGVNEQGETKHLTLAVKRDNAGLGSLPNQYTSATDEYAQLLSKLNVHVEPKAPPAEPTTSSPPSPPVCRNPSRMKFLKQKKLSTATPSAPPPPPLPVPEKPQSPPSAPVPGLHGFVQGETLIGDQVIPKKPSEPSEPQHKDVPSKKEKRSKKEKEKKKKKKKKREGSSSGSSSELHGSGTSKQAVSHPVALETILATPEPSIDVCLQPFLESKSKKRKRVIEILEVSDNTVQGSEPRQAEMKKAKKEEKAARRERKRLKKEAKRAKKALKERSNFTSVAT